jgi:hypothetical protein
MKQILDKSRLADFELTTKMAVVSEPANTPR